MGFIDHAVLCVLKSGGDYTLEYVLKLRASVARHTTVPHQFYCLTDITAISGVCQTIPLVMNYPGWWSKIELFRPDLVAADRLIYFDLDTVIVNNIDALFELKPEFAGLGDWFPGLARGAPAHFGSGLMAWHNNDNAFRFIFDKFETPPYGYNPKLANKNCGDQRYIAHALVDNGVPYEVLQDLMPGIYSYKRNGCNRMLPHDACIVCFHGFPRPHQALGTSWVRQNWQM